MATATFTSDQVDPGPTFDFASVGRQFTDANWTHYYNPMVNKLYFESAVEANPTIRAQQFKEAQRIAWDDAEYLFLYYPLSIAGISDSVHDFNINPTGHYFLEAVSKA